MQHLQLCGELQAHPSHEHQLQQVQLDGMGEQEAVEGCPAEAECGAAPADACRAGSCGPLQVEVRGSDEAARAILQPPGHKQQQQQDQDRDSIATTAIFMCLFGW